MVEGNVAEVRRRRFLAAAGVACLGTVAGCTGQSGDGVVPESDVDGLDVTDARVDADGTLVVTVRNTGDRTADVADYDVRIDVYDGSGDAVGADPSGPEGASAIQPGEEREVTFDTGVDTADVEEVRFRLSCPTETPDSPAYCDAAGDGPSPTDSPTETTAPSPTPTEERRSDEAAEPETPTSESDDRSTPEQALTVETHSTPVEPGQPTTATVGLTRAPEGVGGFEFDVRVADPDVATIGEASFTPALEGGRTVVGVDGTSLTLRAYDLADAIGASYEPVELGSVAVSGMADGETELVVENVRVDGDGGIDRELSAEAVPLVVDAGTGTVPAVDVSLDASAMYAGDETTADLVLSEAPADVTGFQLEVALSRPTAASIEDVTFPERFDETQASVESDGSTVQLDATAADALVAAGETDAVVATVVIAGETEGTTSVAVETASIDTADGALAAWNGAAWLSVVGDATPTPEVSVSVARSPIDAGETTTAEIALSAVPTGLAEYALDVTLSRPEAATIVDASYPSSFGSTDGPTIAPDGSTATLGAVDADDAIGPGDEDVQLATVELEGQQLGFTTLDVAGEQFVDDAGRSIEVTTGRGPLNVEGELPADAPTVRVRLDPETVEGEATTTAEIILSEAPYGLSGYAFDVVLSEPEVAAITDASYPAAFELADSPEFGDDGATVRLEANDLDDRITSGATQVTLATLEIEGEADGATYVEVANESLDDDGGAPIYVAVDPATLTVWDVVGSESTAGSPAE